MFRKGYNGIQHCFDNFGFIDNSIGMFLMFLLVIVITVVIILLITKSKKNQVDDNALEMLKIRFVQGEISEEEFVRMKNCIK